MVEYDAFAGGIGVGGLRNMLEIKILICYVLSRVKDKMPKKLLFDCLLETGLVNFFALNEAVEELVKQSLVVLEENEGEQYYSVTALGRSNADTLETTLSGTTRERSVKAALRMMARDRAERETKAEIVKTDTGYNVNIAIEDSGEKLISLSLYVPDILLAEKLRDGFLDDPAALYTSVIDRLTSEND